MLLHKTSIMELHFDPKTDILSVQWPDLHASSIYDIDHSFAMIRDSVKSFYIKRFLIDSRVTKTVLESDQLLEVFKKFIVALSGIDLKKVARLESLSHERETRIMAATNNIPADYRTEFEFMNFTDEQEAINWLLAD